MKINRKNTLLIITYNLMVIVIFTSVIAFLITTSFTFINDSSSKQNLYETKDEKDYQFALGDKQYSINKGNSLNKKPNSKTSTNEIGTNTSSEAKDTDNKDEASVDNENPENNPCNPPFVNPDLIELKNSCIDDNHVIDVEIPNHDGSEITYELYTQQMTVCGLDHSDSITTTNSSVTFDRYFSFFDGDYRPIPQDTWFEVVVIKDDEEFIRNGIRTPLDCESANEPDVDIIVPGSTYPKDTPFVAKFILLNTTNWDNYYLSISGSTSTFPNDYYDSDAGSCSLLSGGPSEKDWKCHITKNTDILEIPVTVDGKVGLGAVPQNTIRFSISKPDGTAQ